MVVVERLERGFGGRAVLEGLTFEVAPGERVALKGPNGSGKTTLIRCLLGTLIPDAGTVMVAGSPAGSLPAKRRTGASLSQDRSFYLRLTGRENLLFFARLRGLAAGAAKTSVDSLLEELELQSVAERRTDRCSTGQLQQLAFARALIGEPTVLLLDEPTRSLDSEARGRLWDALARRPQAAVVFATHLDEDTARATRVIDLSRAASAA